MRHLPSCPRPGRSGSGAPHAGPAVAGPERFREIVHLIEVLDPVAVLAGEEADVDEHEDDAAEVLRRGDAPVGEHGRSEQAELLQREIAARPGELAAGEMAAGGEPALRVFQRREHEEIGALVIAAVALLQLAEGGFERGEVAHGCASGCRLSPETRARAPLTRGVGTCKCASVSVKGSRAMPRLAARARNRLHAACADSFITSPSWPVRVIWPLPGIWIASTNMMSPPTGVHARPVATPTSGARPATSLCTCGWPA